MESTSEVPDDCCQVADEAEKEALALKSFKETIAEIESHLAHKAQLRSRLHTTVQNRPEESYFTRLDSSIKKNTAFVRKLKNFTEAQKESILKDINTLNLTKYISEVANAIVEAKLKMTDIASILQVCVVLHEKYADFSSQILEAWQKVLSLKKDEKVSNPSKMRVDVRFYADLISCGVLTPKEGLPLLGSFLTNLIHGDKEEHNSATIILAFCKFCGEDYAGLVSQKLLNDAERFKMTVPTSNWLPPDKRQNVRNLLREYYSSLCKHLIQDHKELQNFERQNRRILQTKGELSNERKEKQEVLNQSFAKLLNMTQQFADVLAEELPELRQDLSPRDEECSVLELCENMSDQARETLNELLWENEEGRQFYENLPNLSVYLPNLVPKATMEAPPLPDPAEQMIDIEKEAKEIEEGEQAKEEGDEDIKPAELEDEKDDADVPVSLQSNKVLLDSFLTTLSACVNREMIDSAAIEFSTNLNTKHNRKKLVRALFTVQRTRLDLLPFYSRLVATLHPYIPEVATDLCNFLRQDFKYHVRKKDQINIETKVKIVRFIGELTKFGMYPRADTLQCFKQLLLNFAHHYIEMTCHLLETCGRFLLHQPDSHQRTKVYLDQMMRKKSMLASDSRYLTMIENAYYQVVPVDSSARSSHIKIRPPLHQYIRHLLYVELGNKGSTNKILKQLRKLNWKDPEVASYAIRCLTSAWKVKFPNIRTLAGVVAELTLYQEFVGHRIVDAVLEDIRWSLEFPISKFNQRRVSMAKYLAELYNYRMVESSVVFKVLYTCITFAVSYDRTVESELDQPDNLMRLRLVLTILDTCGVFFSSGLAKKRLDCYLVYLQYYHLFKRSLPIWTEDNPFPVAIDFGIKDMLQSLRPKLKPYKTLQEAADAVENLEKELMNKLSLAMPELHMDVVMADDTLACIEEEDMEEGEEMPEVDDDSINDEQSLSRSMSQMTTRGEATQPDDDSATAEDDRCVVTAPRKALCPEDDDFMAALDRMVAENIHEAYSRGKEASKAPAVDIAIPWQVKASLKKPSEGSDKNFLGDSIGGELGGALAVAEASSACAAVASSPPSASQDNPTVNFFLMTRKGNKPQFKNLALPSDSELAQNLRNREEAEKAEKERVKKLTLDFNERQEEEEFQDLYGGANRPAVHNVNRDRRGRFQHPKGVPDAELIFGGARKNR
ncbi:regulator of nonsense transcripts 2 isoform X2 [Daphnia magna]|uniref:regulator of nonsense transcripts 2 isoform X2 n=1 Tax=Daphnia magna TaxID=35525 RepID=UPI001E1BB230|nr:regulator of nonsense transcripts 2 isoform X2 [Daphnia magna]